MTWSMTGDLRLTENEKFDVIVPFLCIDGKSEISETTSDFDRWHAVGWKTP